MTADETSRLAIVETKITAIKESTERIEKRFDEIACVHPQHAQHFATLDEQHASLDREVTRIKTDDLAVIRNDITELYKRSDKLVWTLVKVMGGTAAITATVTTIACKFG